MCYGRDCRIIFNINIIYMQCIYIKYIRDCIPLSVYVCVKDILKIICIYINKYINEKHITTEHQAKTSVAESSNFLSKLFSMLPSGSFPSLLLLVQIFQYCKVGFSLEYQLLRGQIQKIPMPSTNFFHESKYQMMYRFLIECCRKNCSPLQSF